MRSISTFLLTPFSLILLQLHIYFYPMYMYITYMEMKFATLTFNTHEREREGFDSPVWSELCTWAAFENQTAQQPWTYWGKLEWKLWNVRSQHWSWCRNLAWSRPLMGANWIVGQSALVAFKDRWQVLFSLWKSNITRNSTRSTLAVRYSNLHVLNYIQDRSCIRTLTPARFCSWGQHSIWNRRTWPLLIFHGDLKAEAWWHWGSWLWKCQIYDTLLMRNDHC